MSTAQEIEALKAKGEYRQAGAAARKAGFERCYGCHYGMRSSRDSAIAEFNAGYDAMAQETESEDSASKAKTYLFRSGDGNEGNFPRFLVTLKDSDCPYDAIRALLANEYVAGKRVRRFVMAHTEVVGEADYGLHATVYEGPEGEQAFGAAWITAELQPVDEVDAEYYRDRGLSYDSLRGALDAAAWRFYRKLRKAK